jgi:tRNA threonylcarbamoyladenosine biosynthesis protein TsaE
MDERLSLSERQTHALGRGLGLCCRAGDVIAVLGPLGAGKTRFVQGLARGLDVERPRDVVSPTFTLVDEHPGRLTLWHADLYRIDREDDLERIGLREILPGDGVTAVEWLDRFPAWMPRDYLEVRLTIGRGSRRGIQATAHGMRSQALLAAWLGPRRPARSRRSRRRSRT